MIGFAMVARIIAPVWLVPAVLVNIDWTAAGSTAWNAAAIGCICGSAIFIECGLSRLHLLRTPLFCALGLFMILCNLQTAFDNAAHRSDGRSDGRKALIIANGRKQSQWSQWSQARSQAAMVAGERSQDAYKADIQQLIAQHATNWQATGECTGLKITLPASRAFCAAHSELQGRLAQAELRDKLDGQLRALDAQTALAGEVPTSADPFADNLADFLQLFHVQLSDATKHALSSQKDATRAIALELLASFGPSAHLFLIGLMFPRRLPTPADARRRAPARTELDTQSVYQDPFHQFIAECIEDANGITLRAGEAWERWCAWCARSGAPQGTQKAFGQKMKSRFAHDQNNNRPRYLNVKAKSGAPRLTLVQGAM